MKLNTNFNTIKLGLQDKKESNRKKFYDFHPSILTAECAHPIRRPQWLQDYRHCVMTTPQSNSSSTSASGFRHHIQSTRPRKTGTSRDQVIHQRTMPTLRLPSSARPSPGQRAEHCLQSTPPLNFLLHSVHVNKTASRPAPNDQQPLIQDPVFNAFLQPPLSCLQSALFPLLSPV